MKETTASSCWFIFSVLMDKGGAEPLVRLLTDPKPQTQVNSAVCLTNLANNGTVYLLIYLIYLFIY